MALSLRSRGVSLHRQLTRLEVAFGQRKAATPILEAVRANPTLLMTKSGLPPDPWQERLLRDLPARTLLLASRQIGKSQVAAALVQKRT